ncbi:MAG: tRNA preQ1(34) S-adenosylmethionine ribosyltransferase-isomerase QueA [Deltaproteobacteria bacterium]|nr:tRNA preQ1(34) S-adenosylmethionine ribosyltransferase-isomerase QueA [Deltaproteobacteria bacterium]TLN04534.1 MAG: tRNA preQ1(34) S-adenosylmethionine ribosyltransferase-isomerase QueA [bacterium]
MFFRDYDYELPQELIAQAPADRRDASRLMILDRETGRIDESVFSRIAEQFNPGDLLVLNDTRVLPARLFGEKESGGRVEVFLVRRMGGDAEVWSCLLRSSKKPRPGSFLILPAGMKAQVLERSDDETWLVGFCPQEGFNQWLEEQGRMPLPPYIRRAAEVEDTSRYQTVFARNSGAVAAPTAGLHFTEQLLQEVQSRGVDIAHLTLHVGLGTFLPVRVEEVSEHRMHREFYTIPPETSAAIAARKAGQGRVIALGTTTTRALEHAADTAGAVRTGDGEADIFIHSDYRFKVIDALITNFHLPCSTLLLLVSAFAGKEFLFRAYAEAIRKKFRFFSYGDAMFIR